MTSHALKPSVLAEGQPKLELMLTRKDLGTCPLGVIGNLQFNTEQGGTARACRLGVVLKDMRCLLSKLRSKLTFLLTRAPEQVRAQHDYLAQARRNSRRIGNLLGSLTARAVDESGQSRIAQRLAKLSKSCKGDLAGLPGATFCLSRYVDELSDSDLIALRYGILGCESSREFVLLQVEPDGLRAQASWLLDQIEQVLQPRFEQKVVQEPFGLIARLVSASSVDGLALRAPLVRLAKGLNQYEACRRASFELEDGHQLDRYVQGLPKDQLKALLALMQKDKWDQCIGALSAIEGSGHACDILRRIRGTLGAIPDDSGDRA